MQHLHYPHWERFLKGSKGHHVSPWLSFTLLPAWGPVPLPVSLSALPSTLIFMLEQKASFSLPSCDNQLTHCNGQCFPNCLCLRKGRKPEHLPLGNASRVGSEGGILDPALASGPVRPQPAAHRPGESLELLAFQPLFLICPGL